MAVSVALAVVVIDRWQVTGDRRHMIDDTLQVTHKTWQVTKKYIYLFFFIFLDLGIGAIICLHQEIHCLWYAEFSNKFVSVQIVVRKRGWKKSFLRMNEISASRGLGFVQLWTYWWIRYFFTNNVLLYRPGVAETDLQTVQYLLHYS